MTTKLTMFSRLVLLAGLAYLGFYVFGVVMNAFAPGDIPLLTVIALVVVIAGVVHLLRASRAVEEEDPEEHRERMREQHELRQRRGF